MHVRSFGRPLHHACQRRHGDEHEPESERNLREQIGGPQREAEGTPSGPIMPFAISVSNSVATMPRPASTKPGDEHLRRTQFGYHISLLRLGFPESSPTVTPT